MANPKTTSVANDETLMTVKRVIRENWRRYFKQYLLAFAMLVAVAAATAFPAWIIRDIVNDVFVRQDLQAAYLIAAAVFIAFAVRGFATYGYLYVLGKIGNNIVATYQRKVFAQLLRLGVEFHKSNRSTYLVSHINQNIVGMRTMLNDIVTMFARDLFTLIALIAVMIIQDPYMSIISVAVLPVIALIMGKYVRRIRKVAREQVDLNARVSSAFIENSQGMEIVKSFTMEEQMSKKLYDLTAAAETRSNQIVRLNAKAKPPTEILAGFAIASVVAFGGYRVAELGHDVGSLLSFLTAAMLAYEPARKLASFRVQFEKNVVNARMLFEFLDRPPRQADKPGAESVSFENADISFENVHFAYQDDEPILNGVSIKAKSGETTALVGPSGGGKSTMIALVQRFFDIHEGEIRVDGKDITQITAESLRKSIAYVSQQPILFEGSVLENIRFGRPDATDEQVFEAARQAQAHEFILEQPDGYDTMVGELGGNLSGGQRQRLSIARAFLRNAPILLLDEATSALDNESERLVQQALEKLVEGRTTIVIAHRLSTIRDADKIYVIENGRVTQEGKHATLMKKKTGTYARLHSNHDKSDTIKEAS
ncbi:MAG: ABC transporter ATP-binding protein [Rhizobiaceae bacterium]|nr:ABC transporter ATP-binding protein [Rhizobiaceae bacterium]